MMNDDVEQVLKNMRVPQSDENARKIAVNMALAAFDDVQAEKNKKSSQGNSFFSRLIGNSNPTRRNEMKKQTAIYGGLASVLAVLLVTGVTYTQFAERSAYTESRVMVADALSQAPEAEIPEGDMVVADAQSLAMPEPAQRNVAADAAPQAMMAPASPPVPAGNIVPQGMAGAAPSVSARMKTQSFDSFAQAEAKRAPAKAFIGNGVAIAPAPGMPYPVDVMPEVQENRDEFKNAADNAFIDVRKEAVSTFSIDVDTASYSYVRRMITQGQLPPAEAVRIEEMVNYFDYDYPLADSREQPFKPSVTVVDSPWHEGNKLVHVGIKGYDVERATAPKSNLVFLLDTSGSMNSPDKLPLVVQSLKLMLGTLRPDDTVAIVTYAGSAGTALEPTKVADKAKIIAALDSLFAGGSTAGAAGIEQAYALAQAGFDKEAVNRVILATDGDFNVGVSDPEALKKLIAKKRDTGIFLSVLGFGQGNLQDDTMQELAQNGNGTAAYIDTLNEARKVLVDEATSTLFPIAKDVKIQVEFNPATVAEYRLVGYETRALRNEDFNNDKIDAGEIGAGHAVTAIYEITPVGAKPQVDPSRYQQAAPASAPVTGNSDEYAFLKIRYKLPAENTSKLIETPIGKASEKTGGAIPADTQWAVAVAGFAQLLKDNGGAGDLTYDDVIAAATAARGNDEYGTRAEFLNLVRLAKSLKN